MHALKTMLFIALGLGTVWVARQIAPGESAGLLTGVAFAQPSGDTKAVQPVTNKEVAEQLARINAMLANEGELKEFKPTEPLPADEAIAMSSEL